MTKDKDDNLTVSENPMHKSLEDFRKEHEGVLKTSLYRDGNIENDWIFPISYDAKTGKVKYKFGSRKKETEGNEIALSDFDELLQVYKKVETTTHETDLENEDAKVVEPDPTIELTEIVKNESEIEDEAVQQEGLKEERIEKTQEELKLEDEVKEARKSYAKKDYEVTNIFEKLKKVLGIHLRSSSENSEEKQKKLEDYKLALNDFLNYKIDKLQEKKDLDLEDLKKEIKVIIKYYKEDEKANLYDEHTNVRADVWKEKFNKPLGYLAEKSGQAVNYYRKELGWKKKLVLSSALFSAGLVAGFAGATGAIGAVGAAKIVQRGLAGAATGAGLAGIFEAKHRKEEKEKTEKEKEEIMEKIENDNSDEKIEKIKQIMQEEINMYDKDLQNEKSKALFRESAGVLAGIFVSSGALSHLAGWTAEQTGVSSALKSFKEFWFGKALETPPVISSDVNHQIEPDVSPINSDINSAEPNIPSDDNILPVDSDTSAIPDSSPIVETKLEEVNMHPIEFDNIEVAQKGDSAWKMIGRQLGSHFGDDFDNLDPTRKTYIIDALKDKVAENSSDFGLKNIERIKIGQEVDLTKLFEDKNNIEKIFEQADKLSPEQLKNIAENNESIMNWVENHSDRLLDSSAVEEIISEKNIKVPDTENLPAKSIIPEYPENTVDVPIENNPTILQNQDLVIPKAEEIIAKAEIGNDSILGGGAIIGAGILGSKAKNIFNFYDKKRAFQKMAKRYEFSEGEGFILRAKKTIKNISLGSLENWSAMKNVKMSELGKKNGVLSPKLEKNIINLENDFVALLGEKAKANEEETVKQWIARVLGKSLEENGSVEQKMAA